MGTSRNPASPTGAIIGGEFHHYWKTAHNLCRLTFLTVSAYSLLMIFLGSDSPCASHLSDTSSEPKLEVGSRLHTWVSSNQTWRTFHG